MQETLADVIKNIESLPPATDFNIDEGIRKVFGEWQERNPVVKDVMDGKTTFYREWERYFGEYYGWKLARPFYVPENFEKEVATLEACIGQSPFHSQALNLVANPVSLGLCWGIVPFLLHLPMILSDKPIKEYHLKHVSGVKNVDEALKQSRRSFLKSSLLIFPLIGTLMGGSFSLGTSKQIYDLEQNALYLDAIYTRTYM